MSVNIPKLIIVHCSDTKNGKSCDIETIRKDHIENRGFSDIAYHIIINIDGECHNGRPMNVVGSHTKGHNEGSIGICIIGSNKFTKRQFDSLLNKIDSIRQVYGIPLWETYTHAQFDTAIEQGKTCPNIKINHLLAFLLTENYDCIRQYICEEEL